MRLFCIPYAGGDSMVFRDWQRLLGDTVTVQAAELPGRGRRSREALRSNAAELVDDLAQQCRTSEPLALLGYSFGAILAHALALHLEGQGRAPVRLIVGGARAPFLAPPQPFRHRMNDAELCEELRKANGTDEAVLESAELMSLFLPMLRADFQVVETYRCDPQERLSCPVSVFGADEDPFVPCADLRQWAQLSLGEPQLRLYRGDHFIINSQRAEICRDIRAQLTQDMRATPALMS